MEQRPVRPRELARFESQIKQGIRRLSEAHRASLEQRMSRAVGLLQSACEDPPSNRHAKQACQLITRAFTNGDPRTIVIRMGALALLWDEQPRRFVSDRAYKVNLVRHVRQAGRDFDREHWDPKRGLVIRKMKQHMPPQVAAFAAEYLLDALLPILTLLIYVAKVRVKVKAEETQLMRELDDEIRARFDRRLSEVREALKFFRALKRKLAREGVTLPE